ncbi:unnamed protein product [Scytosiphon promiscuus]
MARQRHDRTHTNVNLPASQERRRRTSNIDPARAFENLNHIACAPADLHSKTIGRKHQHPARTSDLASWRSARWNRTLIVTSISELPAMMDSR